MKFACAETLNRSPNESPPAPEGAGAGASWAISGQGARVRRRRKKRKFSYVEDSRWLVSMSWTRDNVIFIFL
jgi:hypothetical protein